MGLLGLDAQQLLDFGSEQWHRDGSCSPEDGVVELIVPMRNSITHASDCANVDDACHENRVDGFGAANCFANDFEESLDDSPDGAAHEIGLDRHLSNRLVEFDGGFVNVKQRVLDQSIHKRVVVDPECTHEIEASAPGP